MDIRNEALSLEGRMVAAGRNIGEALKRAKVSRESWRSWKRGRGPQWNKFQAVRAAVEELLFKGTGSP